MTEPFRPDDDVVSAVLDGEATADERARVAADPVLSARLAEFTANAEQVAAAGPPPAEAERDRAVAAAVAERHRRDRVVVAMDRRRRRDAGRFLGAAAAGLVVLLAAGLLLSNVDGGGDDSGGDAASSDVAAATADTAAAAESGGSDAAGVFDEGAVVALGAVADEDALREALVTSGAVDPATAQDATGGDDGAGESSTVPPEPDAFVPVPGDSEACQVRLEEVDPSLAGRLAVATTTYAGRDAVVYVFGTAGATLQVVVVATDTCATLADFTL